MPESKNPNKNSMGDLAQLIYDFLWEKNDIPFAAWVSSPGDRGLSETGVDGDVDLIGLSQAILDAGYRPGAEPEVTSDDV